MLKKSMYAKSCRELLETYENNKKIHSVERLEFENMDGLDVYNISVPFQNRGNLYIAGRVEKRTSELSRVIIFSKNNDVYTPASPAVIFQYLQDPFVTSIHGEIIIGGVQIETDVQNHEKIICYRTLFYKGTDIFHLQLFAKGPDRMKDIRITELPDGKIGVFTRPQGGEAGKGKIGFIRLNRLEDLNTENILKAEIINSFFTDDEWGGVNDIHILKNGLLGIVGHIAYMSEGNTRHYFSTAFAFNPDNFDHTPIKIIAKRSDLLSGPTKRKDLEDVLFSGGIIRKGKYAELYTGVSDAEAQCTVIDDPFAEYEQSSCFD